MKRLIIILLAISISYCSKTGEVVSDGTIYENPDEKSKVIEEVKKGAVIELCEYRNHAWNQRDFIKVKSKSGSYGFIRPRHIVAGQNPENSVFTWGSRKDYKPFYAPSDPRYSSGYEESTVKDLPKEKIPLSDLLKDTKL